jgi:hypothetical protein
MSAPNNRLSQHESNRLPGMDAQDHYRRFCNVVRRIAEMRIACDPAFAAQNWVCQCFRSFDAYCRRFPTSTARVEWLERFERESKEISTSVDRDFERLFSEGFNRQDVELFR